MVLTEVINDGTNSANLFCPLKEPLSIWLEVHSLQKYQGNIKSLNQDFFSKGRLNVAEAHISVLLIKKGFFAFFTFFTFPLVSFLCLKRKKLEGLLRES